MSTLKTFSIIVLVGLCAYFFLTGPAAPATTKPDTGFIVKPMQVIDTAQVENTVLGAIKDTNEQTFAKQDAQAIISSAAYPKNELLKRMGLGETFDILIIGEVSAYFDMSNITENSITVAPNGSIFLTLPEPILTAQIDIQNSNIYHTGGILPFADHDRLNVLQGAEPTAREIMMRKTGPIVTERATNNAIKFYTELLTPLSPNNIVTVSVNP